MKIIKSNKKALVVGSTGLIGRHLVEALIENDSYCKVVLITRRPLDIKNSKVVNEVVDFSNLNRCRSIFRGDDLFICIGTTMAKAGSKSAFLKVDFTIPVIVANLAFQNGVDQCLLVSAAGADKNSIVFYNKVKGELEFELKQIGFWGLHIFQPSILLGEREELRIGERFGQLIGRGLNKWTGDMMGAFKAVEAVDVAEAMMKTAQRLEPGIYTYPSHIIEKISKGEI
ncbi:MAG: NAD-dependent epimerase/dehydratase family protein [Bacteroidia bacterium]|nr:NAD-dependent epimerase/dehydratase family protein [Bacteroidia bacterium]